VKATRFTHVSIHAYDMEASLRFYTEVFGMRHVPSPDFEHRVEWLVLGDQQLHLFLRDTPAPEFHHLGLDVDDFETAYRVASERGMLERDTWAPDVRELNDGSVQMYLRDPAGNLIEVNWPDVTTLDRSVVTRIGRLEDERPQSADALLARLYVTA
jgi:lactoylglutathione lyase